MRLGPFLFPLPLLLLGGCSGGSGGSAQAPVPAPAPVASFGYSPASPTAGQTVTFTDTSTGAPVSWAWEFGDGAASAQANPTHVFASVGSYTARLTVTSAGGSSVASRVVTVLPALTAPVASFTFQPSAPVSGSLVTFTDTSSGNPTAWAWDFGDKTTSAQQNPSHTFAGPGLYTVSMTASNAAGATTAARSVVVTSGSGTAFSGTTLLGAPTQTSVKAKVFSADQSGSVVLQYGTAGAFQQSTAPVALAAGTPAEVVVTGLAPDTRYTCRVVFQAAGGGVSYGPIGGWRTARPAGSSFTFTLQADSHMDENSDPDVYARTLANVLADAPDFHVDLGDTFMCEKHSVPLSGTSPQAGDAATVEARYRYDRGYFAAIGGNVPLFLVNGNHEGESGWNGNGTASSLAVWTAQARLRHFAVPFPDDFYSGDTVAEPFVGLRGSYYAWTWGDALFVVLDPFWNTPTQPSKDTWGMTLGSRQYQWLRQALMESRAAFKFIFIHNLVGGLDGQMRGGVEGAAYFEWGGRNLDGTEAFAAKRPGWPLPIHPLLVANKVTAVFHGHDHLYCKQMLDGIIYQELPQPSARNSQSGPGLAQQYHYTSGTVLSSSGHLRVTVSPGSAKAEYIRAWLPSQETATQKNGQVADSWTVTR